MVVADPDHVRQLRHYREVPGAVHPVTPDVGRSGEDEDWLGGCEAGGGGGVPRDVARPAGAGEGAGSVVTDLTAGPQL